MGFSEAALLSKICTCCRINEAKVYLYHSNKVAKAGPGLDDRPEHPSVQINSSSPWYRLNDLLSESGLQ